MASANAGSRGGKREKDKATSEDDRTEDGKGNCGSCGKEVLASQMGIECEICNEWYHGKCQELTKTAYEVITTNKTVHWYCTGCNNGVVNTLQKMKERQEQLVKDLNTVKLEVSGIKNDLGRVVRLEDELCKMKVKVEDIVGQMSKVDRLESDVRKEKDRMVRLESRVSAVEEADSEQKKSFAQIMIEQEEERKSESTGRKTDKEIREQMYEVMEREKRKNNLILVGVEEGLDDQIEKEVVEKIIETLVPETKVKIEIMGRIGRKEQNRIGGEMRPRPLRLNVQDFDDRKRLLSRGKKLKDSEFAQVFVVPDLTRMQQEEDKIIRDKLKEFRNTGRRNVKIIKGEIVEEDGGQRNVLFTLKK